MFSPTSFWYLSLIFFYKFNNLWPGSIFLSLGNSFWKESRSEEKGNESAAKIWPDRRLLANPLTVLFWPFLILCFSSRAQLNAVLTKSSWKSEDGLLYSFSLAMTTEYKKHLLVYNIRQITGRDDVIDRINNQPYIKNNQNLIASFFPTHFNENVSNRQLDSTLNSSFISNFSVFGVSSSSWPETGST